MPRTHPCWAEFNIDVEKTFPDVTCRHCNAKILNSQPSRNLLRHLSKCRGLTEAEHYTWHNFGDSPDKRKRKRQRRKRGRRVRSPPVTQDSVELSQSQPEAPYAFDGKISVELKNRFQTEIASGLYAAGFPFRAIEQPRLRKAFTVLQPEMEKHLPNRKALGVVKTEADKQQITDEAGRFDQTKSQWSQKNRSKQEALSPLLWWSHQKTRKRPETTYPLLAELACVIFTIPTSSASSGRSWSIHDFIHTKRRNRLDVKRVEKLVYIYANAGDEEATTNILYRIDDESESKEESEDESETERGIDGGDGVEAAVAFSFEENNAFSYDGSEEQKNGADLEMHIRAVYLGEKIRYLHENLFLACPFLAEMPFDVASMPLVTPKMPQCMHLPIPKVNPLQHTQIKINTLIL
ncbi:hypothetical protein V7S43_017289 [Phytophthora oleae]|uniref:HAT C-terminal dimerisation domain-containing protein n=1 Tax=Phytophthora oleae TaxID=2107226 RepID=A0ABD3EX63_9STRA